MSAGNLNTELGPAHPVDDDTRRLAIAGVRRWVPADGVDEVLDMLGLGRPAPPVLRNIDGTVSKTAADPRRHCACGKEIRTSGPTCSYCAKKPGARRRTPGATGGDS